LLAFVDQITFDYVERLRKALVDARRDDRAGLHDDVQHYWPKRKTCVVASFWHSGQKQAVVTVGRDQDSLRAELAFEREVSA
jgi:hypothetical protein